MEVQRNLGIDRMSQLMGTNKAFQNSGLKIFEHFSQVYTTTQSGFIKRKLGECAHVIAKIDLTKMDASVLEKFNKKAKNWLNQVHELGKKIGNKTSQKVERQIDATIRRAERDLQTFANVNSAESSKTGETPKANSTNLSWTVTVQQARMGGKIPRNILKNLPEMCQKIFLEKIENLQQRVSPEQLENLQQEIYNFSSHLLEAAKVIQGDNNYNGRMQIICLDGLVDDLALALENKFMP
jgi:hypothetical protein